MRQGLTHSHIHELTHSYAYFAFDVGVWVVALELEVVVVETEDVLLVRIDEHGRQRPGRAGELQAALV